LKQILIYLCNDKKQLICFVGVFGRFEDNPNNRF